MTTKTITKKITSKTAEDSAKITNPDIQTLSKRDIGRVTEVILWTVAGGRCEFCNKYLLEDWLTLTKGKYGQNAHIVGFRKDAARGNISDRPQNIHDVSNLMLLCYEHHRLVDNIQPKNYPREKLEIIKQNHEERIKRLTGIKPENQTTVIRLQAKVGGDCVGISESDIKLALEPFYFPKENQIDIDLTQFDDNDDSFFHSAKSAIKRKISRLYESQIDSCPTDHISVFALAPMPLLVSLGNYLSNKIRVDLYQRHRDTEDWKWKASGQLAQYNFNRLQVGSEKNKVALLLSLTGKIDIADLPAGIDKSFSVYEITLKNSPLSPFFLGLKESLDEFKSIYQIALRTIKANHGNIQAINLFPAVPAPIAVLCGRELLPKVDPELWIYDNDKRAINKGFNLILKVNEYDR
jgi:hypothetical protein